MIKRILIIILILFAFVFSGSGQQKTGAQSSILFRGVVIDASSLTRLPNSQIVINRVRSLISDPEGAFSFYAAKRDTIIFSMLGYKPASLIVSDTIAGTEFLTGVYLENDTILIGEVIILPRLTSLKAEMMNPKITTDPRLENAKSNITTASYVGRTTQGTMGDPDVNYGVLKQKQKVAAFEKGGIPSDMIAGVNPFLLIPAAYLLLHGLPEAPPPPQPHISSKDIDELHKKYLELIKNRK